MLVWAGCSHASAWPLQAGVGWADVWVNWQGVVQRSGYNGAGAWQCTMWCCVVPAGWLALLVLWPTMAGRHVKAAGT